MPNLVEVSYAHTGQSTSINKFGMREMQEGAFEARNAQYLLLKAPPASGKSRALMFIALDKLINQGLSKAIIAVPERSIGGSFSSVELSKFGFFADWKVEPKNNLCTPGGDQSKVQAFVNFLKSEDKVLVCTHATLRFAFEAVDESEFDNVLLAIDEFHHVSIDGENRLGQLLRAVMAKSEAHIVAMTGSYFRGDSVPVLLPEQEVTARSNGQRAVNQEIPAETHAAEQRGGRLQFVRLVDVEGEAGVIEKPEEAIISPRAGPAKMTARILPTHPAT